MLLCRSSLCVLHSLADDHTNQDLKSCQKFVFPRLCGYSVLRPTHMKVLLGCFPIKVEAKQKHVGVHFIGIIHVFISYEEHTQRYFFFILMFSRSCRSVLVCLTPQATPASLFCCLQEKADLLIVSRFSGVFLLIMYVQLLIFQVSYTCTAGHLMHLKSF